jgi:putative copper export protein
MLVAQAFVRSIHYISIVGLAALCVGPVVLRLGPRLGFARLERILAGVAAISWCALLVFTVLGWNDGNWQSLADPGTWRALLETSYGRTWCERFALLVACIFLCPIAKLGWMRVGLAELACVSMAITGHASADPRGIGSLHIGIDAVHLFSVTLWPGGLLFLFFLLLPDRIPIFELPRVVSRFSTMSLIAAGALLVTGIGNVALTVEHWDLGEAIFGPWP